MTCWWHLPAAVDASVTIDAWRVGGVWVIHGLVTVGAAVLAIGVIDAVGAILAAVLAIGVRRGVGSIWIGR